MEPMNLYGMGYVEEDNRSYYIIAKKNNIMAPINEIMEKIDFDQFFFYENDDPETSINELRHIHNHNYDLDFVFTKNRLIIIIRADKKHQLRFKELILAYSKFQE